MAIPNTNYVYLPCIYGIRATSGALNEVDLNKNVFVFPFSFVAFSLSFIIWLLFSFSLSPPLLTKNFLLLLLLFFCFGSKQIYRILFQLFIQMLFLSISAVCRGDSVRLVRFLFNEMTFLKLVKDSLLQRTFAIELKDSILPPFVEFAKWKSKAMNKFWIQFAYKSAGSLPSYRRLS